MSGTADIYSEEYYLGLPVDSARIDILRGLIELDANDVVCEIGCAAGHFLAAIAPDIHFGVGIDTAEAAISAAVRLRERDRIDNIEFAAISAEDFALQDGNDGRFDTIFLMDVTEHIDDPTLKGILDAARRMLADDGRLIVHTPNLDYWLERLKDRNLLPQLEGHIAVRNAEQHRRLFAAAGFTVTECAGLAHYRQPMRLLDSVLRVVPVIGGLFASRLYMIFEKQAAGA